MSRWRKFLLDLGLDLIGVWTFRKMCILLWLWIHLVLLGDRSHFSVCYEPPTGQFWFISLAVWCWHLGGFNVVFWLFLLCAGIQEAGSGMSLWVTMYLFPNSGSFLWIVVDFLQVPLVNAAFWVSIVKGLQCFTWVPFSTAPGYERNTLIPSANSNWYKVQPVSKQCPFLHQLWTLVRLGADIPCCLGSDSFLP